MTTLKEYKAMMDGATDEPWSFSPQRGTKGHCFQAQVWDSKGDSLAIIESTAFEKYATSDAKFIAASRNIAQELIRVIELAEEALEHYTKVVEADNDQNSFAPKVMDAGFYAREALSEIRKLKGE